jgi:hypothetical protein
MAASHIERRTSRWAHQWAHPDEAYHWTWLCEVYHELAENYYGLQGVGKTPPNLTVYERKNMSLEYEFHNN